MVASAITNSVTGGTSTKSTPVNNTGASFSARRSSQGTLFSGLVNQKRNSGDAAAQARRESFNDMKPAPGLIGKMWNNFVAGSPPK
ncbi:uncharacterized protein RAG0_02139 [Rhynchosporium agropyri]|uniref:Conidiation-specific protein 8 n=1 Tax=Rhynchosporium agropyri TaxID=914238 RepID=A0A1E1K0Y7_9HELO|nr:uncharacterized protein RAG0_02139 [Rhynchosporium agropyri]